MSARRSVMNDRKGRAMTRYDAAWVAAEEARRTADYEATFNNPYRAAARGFVDDVIEASRTRPYLIRSLELLRTKREQRPVRKHGNIPL